MAKAAGFPRASTVRTMIGVRRVRRLVHEGDGPLFAQVKVAADKPPLALPPTDDVLLAARFRAAVLGARTRQLSEHQPELMSPG